MPSHRPSVEAVQETPWAVAADGGISQGLGGSLRFTEMGIADFVELGVIKCASGTFFPTRLSVSLLAVGWFS